MYLIRKSNYLTPFLILSNSFNLRIKTIFFTQFNRGNRGFDN